MYSKIIIIYRVQVRQTFGKNKAHTLNVSDQGPVPQTGLSSGAIAGIVICVLLAVVVVCGLGYVFIYPTSKGRRCLPKVIYANLFSLKLFN